MGAPTVIPQEELPERVRIVDPVWIPMRDGRRLAARVWFPETSVAPAVLEAMPYRRGDISLVDDEMRFRYVAAHGYVCIRVDLRGSGDSDGVLDDEYSEQEQADVADAISWVSEQHWCTGKVGVTGISWSGCSSALAAWNRVPGLAAVITACSSDDRFRNDVHYIGGAVLGFYMHVWSHVMTGFNARPPDPVVVGSDWRRMWLERLEANRMLSQHWLSHPTRDEYWSTGSIAADYGRIAVPTLALGGWADSYTDSALRMGLHVDNAPVWVIIGPWGHTWPERAVPGPSIDYLREAVRWWSHWLKGVPNGIEDEPPLRYYQQRWDPPAPDAEIRSGSWRSSAVVPTVDRSAVVLHLTSDGALDDKSSGPFALTCRTPQSFGSLAGSWLPWGNPTDLPADQAPEDSMSLTFDGPRQDVELEFVGEPVLRLTVRADKPQAHVIVRLCDVAPDGTSLLLTRGVLNLTHREGHDHAVALEPGEDYDVVIPLKGVAATIAPGHRLRVALSTTYWPWIWPAPEEAIVTVRGGTLALPLQPDEAILPPAVWGPPVVTAAPEVQSLRPRRPLMGETSVDPQTGEHVYTLRRDLNGIQRFPNGLLYDDSEDGHFVIRDGDPLSARLELSRTVVMSRDDGWSTRVETNSTMSSTASDFLVRTTLRAWEGEALVFSRDYSATVARHHN
jgi:putative CocE/NonD family hydrolase